MIIGWQSHGLAVIRGCYTLFQIEHELTHDATTKSQEMFCDVLTGTYIMGNNSLIPLCLSQIPFGTLCPVLGIAAEKEHQ